MDEKNPSTYQHQPQPSPSPPPPPPPAECPPPPQVAPVNITSNPTAEQAQQQQQSQYQQQQQQQPVAEVDDIVIPVPQPHQYQQQQQQYQQYYQQQQQNSGWERSQSHQIVDTEVRVSQRRSLTGKAANIQLKKVRSIERALKSVSARGAGGNVSGNGTSVRPGANGYGNYGYAQSPAPHRRLMAEKEPLLSSSASPKHGSPFSSSEHCVVNPTAVGVIGGKCKDGSTAKANSPNLPIGKRKLHI